MIKAILFDLDGTLLDRDSSLNYFVAEQYDRFYFAFKHVAKAEYMSRFIELDCNGYVWKDKVYRQLIEELQISQLSAEELLHDYLTMFHKSCVPFPNMKDTLQSLTERHFKLGLITNGFTAMQKASIEALGIERFFDVIFISEQIGLRKPDPQIFWSALQKIEAMPGESIYVGDHPINDIVAAQSAGMLGVWKRSGHWTDEIEADYKIDDLSEILALPILTE